jgi:hypothetical protein
LHYRKKSGFQAPHSTYLNKLSNAKKIYSHPIKDWSIFSYNKYLNQK